MALMFGCTSSNQTYISYSPTFKVEITSRDLEQATIFLSDGISVKFSDESSISGLLITKKLESLNSSFNLHDYPKYILGLKNLNGLQEQEANLFSSSLKEIQYSYNLQNISEYHADGKSTYVICSSESCLSYIVKAENVEQILMVTGINIQKSKFIQIIKGI